MTYDVQWDDESPVDEKEYTGSLLEVESGGDAILQFGKFKGRYLSMVMENDPYYIPKILAMDAVPDDVKVKIKKILKDLEIPLIAEVRRAGNFSWVKETDGDIRLLFGKYKEVSLKELLKGGKKRTITFYMGLDYIPEELREDLQNLILDEGV